MQSVDKLDHTNCLAYHVLSNMEDWVGDYSVRHLGSLLAGAAMRAWCVEPDLPDHQVSGVFNVPDFYSDLVAATGHPSLSIRWLKALEFTHFSGLKACEHLLERAKAWQSSHSGAPAPDKSSPDLDWPGDDEFWEYVAKMPPMYLCDWTGWSLYCFLTGATRGGDWLGLPPAETFVSIREYLFKRSRKAYGSEFGIFRVYDASELIEKYRSSKGS